MQPEKEDGNVEYKLKYLQLYPSKFKMKSNQDKVYNAYMDNILPRNILYLEEDNIFTQISIMTYPINIDINDNSPGITGLNKCMHVKKKDTVQYKYKDNILKKYGEIFDINKINEYSAKIKTILDILIKDKADGIIFIYSRLIWSSIIP